MQFVGYVKKSKHTGTQVYLCASYLSLHSLCAMILP